MLGDEGKQWPQQKHSEHWTQQSEVDGSHWVALDDGCQGTPFSGTHAE